MFYAVCHNIRSAYNVGSIFRTSDGVGVDKIYLCGYTPSPDANEKIKKTALGAELNVAWEKCFQTARLVKKLKNKGFIAIALEKIGKKSTKKSALLNNFKIKKSKIVLIVGSEVSGISRNILDLSDFIPTSA